MKKYKLIGLTGQSGAGKSTVAELFRQNGAYVINADKLVAEIYKPNSVCVEVLTSLFGAEIINLDGVLDRKKLAEIVFSEEKYLKQLNSVVHPFVMALFLERIKQIQKKDIDMIVYDAPQLFEANADAICDAIVSVTAKKRIRIERICKRDSITEEQAEQRMNAQFDESVFIKKSDFIIENNSDFTSLKTQFDEIFIELP